MITFIINFTMVIIMIIIITIIITFFQFAILIHNCHDTLKKLKDIVLKKTC